MSYYDGPLFKVLSICKGGGYRYARTEPPHPQVNANGLYPLHRVLAANMIGRPIASNEVVHHRDEDPSNNAPANLQVMTRAEHARLHAPTVAVVECTCPVCSTGFSLKPHKYRRRLKMSKHGVLFCSRSCGTRYNHAH